MSPLKRQARTAGFIYFLLAITSVVSFVLVPKMINVPGDAAATIDNIQSSELLFRTGIFAGLITQIIFIVLVLALYRLLKDVNQKQAVLMVSLVLVSASAGFANSFNQIAVLILLGDADFLSAFDKSFLDTLSYFFLRLHAHALQAIQVFWGLWLIPFGFLVYKSQFIPKIFGVLLVMAGSGYLINSFMYFILPQFRDMLSSFLIFLEMGELPIVFWLLIVGAKLEKSK